VSSLLDASPTLLLPPEQQVLRQTLEVLAAEHAARKSAADEASRQLVKRVPRGTPVVRLPFVGPASPRDIVLSLADEWSKIKL
jgi:hypothetical protein